MKLIITVMVIMISSLLRGFSATMRRPNRVDSSPISAPNTRMVALNELFWSSCMSRTFIVHASLHWTERVQMSWSLSDPLLWHIRCGYSHVPNVWSDLTPLELITRECSHDEDFLNCHVCGSPVFVFWGQTTEWSQTSHMELTSLNGSILWVFKQTLFFGGLCLSTTFISPWFHVVLNYLFKTLNWTGADKTFIKSICHEPFRMIIESCTLCRGNELNEVGNIIYQPNSPP